MKNDFGSCKLEGMEEFPAEDLPPEEQKLIAQHGNTLVELVEKKEHNLKSSLEKTQNIVGGIVGVPAFLASSWLMIVKFDLGALGPAAAPVILPIIMLTAIMAAGPMAIAAEIVEKVHNKEKIVNMRSVAKRIAHYLNLGEKADQSSLASLTNSCTPNSSARAVPDAPTLTMSSSPL